MAAHAEPSVEETRQSTKPVDIFHEIHQKLYDSPVFNSDPMDYYRAAPAAPMHTVIGDDTAPSARLLSPPSLPSSVPVEQPKTNHGPTLDSRTLAAMLEKYTRPAINAAANGKLLSNASFSIDCNNCNHPAQNAHWHCSTCDGGDFDLCEPCVEAGVTCEGNQEGARHWLIKRFIEDGKVITSTTETIAPKIKAEPEPELQQSQPDFNAGWGSYEDEEAVRAHIAEDYEPLQEPRQPVRIGEKDLRTCNSCIEGMCLHRLITVATRMIQNLS